MPIKPSGTRSAQTGITSATPEADRTIMLRSGTSASIAMVLTTGPAATGAQLEVTNSSHDDVRAGTALWVFYDTVKNVSQINASSSGDGCQISACRITVTDGTWTLQVSQLD